VSHLQPLLILLDEDQDRRLGSRRYLVPEFDRNRRSRRHINILRPLETRTGSGGERLPIFVVGENLAGRHGKGASLHARQHHGAVYGQGEGLQGSSYGIPTKDEKLRTLPLEAIQGHVERFKEFTRQHPEMTFPVTAVGCGLAGYKPEQIAPFFADSPVNCVMPDEFVEVLRLDEVQAANDSPDAHLASSRTSSDGTGRVRAEEVAGRVRRASPVGSCRSRPAGRQIISCPSRPVSWPPASPLSL
jgi:hypothetical protein